MTTLRFTLLAAACGSLIAALPATTAAQANRIVVTPYVGAFIPAAEIAHLSGTGNSGLRLTQENAVALGLNASYWFNDRTGVEFGGLYAFSDARVLHGQAGGLPGFGGPTRDAYVLAGSAKLMFNLLPLSDRTALRFGVGPAVIRRDGRAYDATTSGVLTGLTDIGGAISLCTRLPLTDLVGVRIRVEDYIYRSKMRWVSSTPAEVIEFDRRVQNDFIVSAGLQVAFWR